MFEIVTREKIWIVLVLRLALNSADALEYPCRLTAGNGDAQWMNEDGSLRFPAYFEGEDVRRTPDELIVYKNITRSQGTTLEQAGEDVACRFSERTRDLLCKEQIDFQYLKSMRNKKIRTLTIDSYNIREVVKQRKDELRTIWPEDNPSLKVTGELKLRDIHISIRTILYVRKEKDKFAVDGEVFSNKILKLGWKYKGEIFSSRRPGKGVMMEMAATSSEYEGGWLLRGNIDFANGIAFFNGIVYSTGHFISGIHFEGFFVMNGTERGYTFFGTLEAKQMNVVGDFTGRATMHLKQVTIPRGVFSGLTVRNILFKNSYFSGGFNDNCFEGVKQLETITFSKCRMDFLPEYDEIFGGSSLKALYIEGCHTPSLKMSVSCSANHLELLSFKESGFLEFSNQSFLWLSFSNLTFLNLHDTNFKIIGNNSILHPVRNTLKYLDVSYSTLNDESGLTRILTGIKITHLSLAGLQLKRVPTSALEKVKDTLQYLSLRKNIFEKTPGANMLLPVLTFPELGVLRELDLQSCRINYVDKSAFDFLDGLEILDLSHNNIINLQDGWVETRPRILTLNLSYNELTIRAPEINLITVDDRFDLRNFERLEILDLSNSNFWSNKRLILKENNNLQKLSLCNCGLHTIDDSLLRLLTNVTEIDLSGNPRLGKRMSFFQLKHIKNVREVHLACSGLVNLTLDDGDQMTSIQRLDLSNNYIRSISSKFLKAMPNLKVLKLSGNSISRWTKNILHKAPSLESLFLDNNKIESLTSTTIKGLGELQEISLGGNPFVCGSYVLDFVQTLRKTESGYYSCPKFVMEMKKIDQGTTVGNHFIRKVSMDSFGTFRRLYLYKVSCAKISDWDEDDYQCYSPSMRTILSFVHLNDTFEECQIIPSTDSFDWIYVAVIGVLLCCVFVGLLWRKWWSFRLFSEMLTAAAVFGFTEDDGHIDTYYEYDAFISYTDRDRPWVIEKLIPRLENLGNVKICLHERDFQVGTSILENIVTSIDKSKCVILVLSQAFINSQWCQYEMHLAYHRLLETKRDQMIMIFLENIPRFKRPKTLRYLMMTKTYIQWPSDKTGNVEEVEIFWNRLFRALHANQS